ncbi:plasmid recombination protein [Turicibacter sp.]|uniref:plasmid recombination protein n=1 Tax=Turicibacter sp. TaxID=2049042 RepID=UPI00257C3FBE|nr:plasmid recombination protein [Turicibacter sp.]
MATISFHVGTTTSISHNNRHHVSGNPDIDLDRLHENIYYVQRDIREVYSENFDKAVKEYNEKQKRSDRKIDDYYSKILHDKKTHHQRELIVAIGSKDDDTDVYSKNSYREIKKNILDSYMKEFQERNPNLKVYNAVMHLDEANPHLHINYVPVYEAKRGLSKRVGQDQALEQQGFKSFEEWRERETYVLEERMNDYRLNRHFKDTGEHLGVKEYKTIKDDIKRLREEEINLGSRVYRLRESVRDYNNFEIPHKKTLLGEVKMLVDDFEKFQNLVKSAQTYDINYRKLERKQEELDERERGVKDRERRLDLKELDDPIRNYRMKALKLEEENKKLLTENQTLKQTVDEQTKEIESKDTLLKNLYMMIRSATSMIQQIREKDDSLKVNNPLRAFTKTLKSQALEYLADIRVEVSKTTRTIATKRVESDFEREVGRYFKQTYDYQLDRIERSQQRVKKKKISERGMER